MVKRLLKKINKISKKEFEEILKSTAQKKETKSKRPLEEKKQEENIKEEISEVRDINNELSENLVWRSTEFQPEKVEFASQTLESTAERIILPTEEKKEEQAVSYGFNNSKAPDYAGSTNYSSLNKKYSFDTRPIGLGNPNETNNSNSFAVHEEKTKSAYGEEGQTLESSRFLSQSNDSLDRSPSKTRRR